MNDVTSNDETRRATFNGAIDAGRPIRLNVGGAIFATSLSTLMRFPDSMLGRMFGGDIPTAKDETGAVFIDRDGEMFRHVLNFLRHGRLHLPSSFDQFDLLHQEADFFCLESLTRDLTRIQREFDSIPRPSGGRRFDDGFLVRVDDDVEGRSAIECRLRADSVVLERLVDCSPFLYHDDEVAASATISKARMEFAFSAAKCELLQSNVWSFEGQVLRESSWFVPLAALKELKTTLR